MLKRVIFLALVVLAGCSNPPAPKENSVKTETHKKPKAVVAKAEASYWKVNSFSPKDNGTEARKFVRFVTEGTFSDSTQTNAYLYAEVLLDKQNGGIFLHELKKSTPMKKFNGPVKIEMTNSAGQSLQMTSTRSWSKTGGISIERNNNDYSQFRIFMLQSTGNVTVEIKDSGSRVYNFVINTAGLSDSFNQL